MSDNLGGAERLESLLHRRLFGSTLTEERGWREELPRPVLGIPSPEIKIPADHLWLFEVVNNLNNDDRPIESFYLALSGHFKVDPVLTPQFPSSEIRDAYRVKHRRPPGTYLVHTDDFGLWILEKRIPPEPGAEKVWKYLRRHYNQNKAKLDEDFTHAVWYYYLIANDPVPAETASRVWLSELILALRPLPNQPRGPKQYYQDRVYAQRVFAQLQSVEYAQANWRAGLQRRFKECKKRHARLAHNVENRLRNSQLYFTASDIVRGIRSNHTARPKYKAPVEPRLFPTIMSDNEDMDLFGDVDEELVNSPRREDSGRELDSADDEDRERREPTQEPEAYRAEETQVVPHPVPTPSDGELNTLRVPDFVRIQAEAFNASTFAPPSVEENESAFSKAASTIRYKKNEDGKLESNALFNRWSDGSVTISIGDVVYELMAKPLAPKIYKDYQDVLDSHTYLATPHVDYQLMQIVGHVNNSFTVVPNADLQAKAVARLKERMSKSGRHNDHKDVANQIVRTEDPDTQKRNAEAAERQRNKLQKRKEQAAARTEQRIRGPASGLGGMERLGGKIKRAPAKKARARRDDYDSEDDDRGRGGRREDEYDMEDDFLAASDEEDEAGEGGDSEEDYDRPSPPRAKKQKRAAKGSDVDASGESDDGARQPYTSQPDAGGRRKRQVIEDDDDE